MKIDRDELFEINGVVRGVCTGETSTCQCGGIAHEIHVTVDKVDLGKKMICEGMLIRANDFTIAVKEDQVDAMQAFIMDNLFYLLLKGFLESE